MILVGDSVGMVALGHETTVPVTVDDVRPLVVASRLPSHQHLTFNRSYTIPKLSSVVLVEHLLLLTCRLAPTRSALKMQSVSLRCFPDKTGFAVGSIEGRVGIQYVAPGTEGRSFAFKCHGLSRAEMNEDCISSHETQVSIVIGSSF